MALYSRLWTYIFRLWLDFLCLWLFLNLKVISNIFFYLYSEGETASDHEILPSHFFLSPSQNQEFNSLKSSQFESSIYLNHWIKKVFPKTWSVFSVTLSSAMAHFWQENTYICVFPSKTTPDKTTTLLALTHSCFSQRHKTGVLHQNQLIVSFHQWSILYSEHMGF